MLETLISSKTRIKLLMKFFLNSNNESYLRGLESEFGESSNAIRIELNRLEKASMLISSNRGNRRYFKANKSHPLYVEVHNILLKHIGIDKIIEGIVKSLGDVRKVFLTGQFARGIDSSIIDIIIVGDVDVSYLVQLIERVEKLIQRKVRYLLFEKEEELVWDSKIEPLLIWSAELNEDENE
jgi:hypothetical protein